LLQSLGISLPPVLSEAVQQVFETISSALSTVSNLGSDLSEENREEAQQVVLAVIILPQLAMAAIGRNK
jgi:cation transporter-like permease